MFKKLKYWKYFSKILVHNWSNTKISYSQHGEDNIISALSPVPIKSFIDIGANDGVLFSNTFKFAKEGASGLCIEPSSKAFRKLCLNHLFHPKVKCLKGAISNSTGILYLKEDGYEETLSTVSDKPSDACKKIHSYKFDCLLHRFPKYKNIDLLSIDVEGHELKVFQDLDNKSFYSRFIIIESDKLILDELLNLKCLSEYEVIGSNGLNTFLKHKTQKVNTCDIASIHFHNLLNF